jgi:hypothetical protein
MVGCSGQFIRNLVKGDRGPKLAAQVGRDGLKVVPRQAYEHIKAHCSTDRVKLKAPPPAPAAAVASECSYDDLLDVVHESWLKVEELADRIPADALKELRQCLESQCKELLDQRDELRLTAHGYTDKWTPNLNVSILPAMAALIEAEWNAVKNFSNRLGDARATSPRWPLP